MKRLLSPSRKWVLAAAGAACLALPAASRAADNNGRFDRGGIERRNDDHRVDPRNDRGPRDSGRERDGSRVNVDIHIGSREPQYETREVRVWVPPVYRTVSDRRWVEPVYRTETERVWVPDRYEDREYRGPHGRLRVERVLCESGHYETIDRRVCVSEGHWENCDRQELVREGHYEVHTERVPRPYRLSPFEVVNPALAGIGFNIGR